jgi:hypothetical protein
MCVETPGIRCRQSFQPLLVLYRQHSLTSAADLPSGYDAGCGGMAVVHCPFLVACEDIFGIRYDVADIATDLSPNVPQTYSVSCKFCTHR